MIRATRASSVDVGKANVEAVIASLDQNHRKSPDLEPACTALGMTVDGAHSTGLAAMRRIP